MILRRINGHVKDQNWFAVGLDFLMVVAGILIAFQITTWNQDRENRNKESQYLLQLVEDLHADLVRVDYVQRVAEQRMSALQAILELAGEEPLLNVTYTGNEIAFEKTPVFESKDPYEITTALSNAAQISRPRPTYQTLISTGDIGLIRNRELARAIQIYYAGLDFTESIGNSSLDLYDLVMKSRLRLGMPLAGRVDIQQLAAAAVSDRQFSAELHSYWTASAFQVRFVKRLREQTDTMIEAIEAELQE